MKRVKAQDLHYFYSTSKQYTYPDLAKYDWFDEGLKLQKDSKFVKLYGVVEDMPKVPYKIMVQALQDAMDRPEIMAAATLSCADYKQHLRNIWLIDRGNFTRADDPKLKAKILAYCHCEA